MLLLNSEMATSERSAIVRKGMLLTSALLAVIGSFWIGRSFLVDGKLRFGNPPELVGGGDSLEEESRHIRAEVTRVRGNPVVNAGDKCEFLVERHVQPIAECSAQVVCGGRLLYGGPRSGYFRCKLLGGEKHDLIGTDPSTTSSDQDAALHINTREGVMRIWDDERGPLGEFNVEAEILSIQ